VSIYGGYSGKIFDTDLCAVAATDIHWRLPGLGSRVAVTPSQIVNLPARYTYSNTALPCTDCFDHEDTNHDTDFDPDMLTDEG